MSVNSRIPLTWMVVLILALMVFVALFKRLGLSQYAQLAYYAIACVAIAGWFNRRWCHYAWYWVTLLACAALHVPLVMLYAGFVGLNASVPSWALALWSIVDVGFMTIALLLMQIFVGNPMERTEES